MTEEEVMECSTTLLGLNEQKEEGGRGVEGSKHDTDCV